MANGIERGITIQTENDVRENLRGTTERGFALFLLQVKTRNPLLEIRYEPQLFEHITEDGKPEGTLPDFFVRNTAIPFSRGTYIEITSASANGRVKKNGDQDQGDPKEKQKRVMQQVAPDKHYVVLYREDLEKMQRALRRMERFQGITLVTNRNEKHRPYPTK